jgi:hypothetical protein
VQYTGNLNMTCPHFALVNYYFSAVTNKPALDSNSVAEPHPFYATPGENFDAGPADPAPTLLNGRPKFLLRTKS